MSPLMDGSRGSLRYYPEFMPEFEYEPTRDRFHIGFEGDELGEGVRSLVDFEPGDIVFVCTGFFSAEVTRFSLQIEHNLHLHDPFFYGKMLHSCDPNTHVDVAARTFRAIKAIRPGDFVTMDYAQTEDYLFRTFPCACGAATCRKTVLGRMQQVSVEDRQRERLPASVSLKELITPPMDMFEVLKDHNRRRIVSMLLEGDMRIQDMLLQDIRYSVASQHLRILRQMGLVTQYRLGRQVYYSCDDQQIKSLFEQGHAQIQRWMDSVNDPAKDNRPPAVSRQASRG